MDGPLEDVMKFLEIHIGSIRGPMMYPQSINFRIIYCLLAAIGLSTLPYRMEVILMAGCNKHYRNKRFYTRWKTINIQLFLMMIQNIVENYPNATVQLFVLVTAQS